jgi:hypothetical protein
MSTAALSLHRSGCRDTAPPPELICGRMLAGLLLCAVVAAPARAQQAPPPTAQVAYGVEAAGGVTGSALGFGTVLLLAESNACGDDLSCVLGHVALALTAASVGSAVGAYAAGRTYDTRPSGPGAVAGALAGAVVGVGVDHLLRDELNVGMGKVATVAVFALTQGVVTALGSRVAAALRDR